MSYDINNQIDYNYLDLEGSSSDESAAPERDVLEILASRERVEEEINPTGNPVHVSLSNLDHGDRAVLRISGQLSFVYLFAVLTQAEHCLQLNHSSADVRLQLHLQCNQ